MMGISVTALLKVNFSYLYQGKNLFAKILQFSVYTRSRFVCVSDSVLEGILTSVFQERFPEIESLTENQSLACSHNRKDVLPYRQPEMPSQL